MTNIDERAEFEKWFRREIYNHDYDVRRSKGNGAYQEPRTSFMYMAWQARATLPTAEVPEYEVVRIMAIAVHPKRAGAEEYAKQLAAYRALSDNGYKVVRK